MNDKYWNDAKCWELAKLYFSANGKDHISRMIERAVELQNEETANGLDSKKP